MPRQTDLALEKTKRHKDIIYISVYRLILGFYFSYPYSGFKHRHPDHIVANNSYSSVCLCVYVGVGVESTNRDNNFQAIQHVVRESVRVCECVSAQSG